MLPILFLAGSPPLPALGVAQGIQISVATAATVGNLVFSGSSVNPYLALILTGALVVSVPVGAVVAHHVPKKTLKSIVTVALLVAAVASLCEQLWLRSVIVHGFACSYFNI